MQPAAPTAPHAPHAVGRVATRTRAGRGSRVSNGGSGLSSASSLFSLEDDAASTPSSASGSVSRVASAPAQPASAPDSAASSAAAAATAPLSFSAMLREIDALNDGFAKRHSALPDVSSQAITPLTASGSAGAEVKWAAKVDIEYGQYAFFKLSLPKQKAAAKAPPPGVDALAQVRALFLAFKLLGGNSGELCVYVSASDGPHGAPKRPTRYTHTWSLERGAKEMAISSRSEPRFNESASSYYIGITVLPPGTGSGYGSAAEDHLTCSGSTPSAPVVSKRAKEATSAAVLLKIAASGDEDESSGFASVMSGQSVDGFARKNRSTANKLAEHIRGLKTSAQAMEAFQNGIAGIIHARLEGHRRRQRSNIDPDWQRINQLHTKVGVHASKKEKDQLQRDVIRPQPTLQATSDQAHTHAPLNTQAPAARGGHTPGPFSQHITKAQPFHFHLSARSAAATRPHSPTAAPGELDYYSTFGQSLGAVTPASPQQLAGMSRLLSVSRKHSLKGGGGGRRREEQPERPATNSSNASTAPDEAQPADSATGSSIVESLQIVVNPEEEGLLEGDLDPASPRDFPRFQPGTGPASLSGAQSTLPAHSDFSLPFALDAPPLALTLKGLPTSKPGGRSSAPLKKKRASITLRKEKDDGGGGGSSSLSSTLGSVSSGAADDPFLGLNFLGGSSLSSMASVASASTATTAARDDEQQMRSVLAIDVSLDDILRAPRSSHVRLGTTPLSTRSHSRLYSHTPSPAPATARSLHHSPTRFRAASPPNALARSPVRARTADADAAATARSEEAFLLALRNERDAEKAQRQETSQLLQQSLQLRATRAEGRPPQSTKSKAPCASPAAAQRSLHPKDEEAGARARPATTASQFTRSSEGEQASEEEEEEEEDEPVVARHSPSLSIALPPLDGDQHTLAAEEKQPPSSPALSTPPVIPSQAERQRARDWSRRHIAFDLRSARKALSSSLRARQELMATTDRRAMMTNTLAVGAGSSQMGPFFRDKADPAKWVSGVFAIRHTDSASGGADPEARGIRDALATAATLPTRRHERAHVTSFLVQALTSEKRKLGPDGARRVKDVHPLSPLSKKELLLQIGQLHVRAPSDASAAHCSNSSSSTRGSQCSTSRVASSAASKSRAARPASQGSKTSRPSTTPSFSVALARRRLGHVSMDSTVGGGSGAGSSEAAAAAARHNQALLASLKSDSPAEGDPRDLSRAVSDSPSSHNSAAVSPRHALLLPHPPSPLTSAISISSAGASPPVSGRTFVFPGFATPISAVGHATPNHSSPLHKYSSLSAGDRPVTAAAAFALSPRRGSLARAPSLADEEVGQSEHTAPASVAFTPPVGPVDILLLVRESSWWSGTGMLDRVPTDILSLIGLLLDWGRSFLPRFVKTIDSLEAALLASLLHLPPVELYQADNLEADTVRFVQQWTDQQEAIFRTRLGGVSADAVSEQAPTSEGSSIIVEPASDHAASLELLPSSHPLRDTALWRSQKKQRARWVAMDRRVYELLCSARYRASELAWELDQLADRMAVEHEKRRLRSLYQLRSKKGHLVPTVPSQLPNESDSVGHALPDGSLPFDADQEPLPSSSFSSSSSSAGRMASPEVYEKPTSWGIRCFTPGFTELPPRPATSTMDRVRAGRAELRLQRARNMSKRTRPTRVTATNRSFSGTTNADDPFPSNPAAVAAAGTVSEATDSEAEDFSPWATPAVAPAALGASATPVAPSATPLILVAESLPTSSTIQLNNVWSDEQHAPRWSRFMKPPEKTARKAALFARPLRERLAHTPTVVTNWEAQATPDVQHANSRPESDVLGLPHAPAVLADSLPPVESAADPAAAAVRQQRQIALAKRAASYGALLAEQRSERSAELARLAGRERPRSLVQRGFSASFQSGQMAPLVNPRATVVLAMRRNTGHTTPTSSEYEEARRARHFGDEPLAMYLSTGRGPKLDIMQREELRRKYKEQKLKARTEAVRRKLQAGSGSADLKPERAPFDPEAAAATAQGIVAPIDPDFDEPDGDMEETTEVPHELSSPRAILRSLRPGSTHLDFLSPALRAAQFELLSRGRVGFGASSPEGGGGVGVGLEVDHVATFKYLTRDE